MDTSASVSGGFKGFSAAASAAYGEVNNLVTSSQDDSHIEWGKMTTYNPLDYQIEREVTTRVQIDGKTALYVEKRYVDSTDRDEKWEKEQREEASERYLKRRFYGEDDKISGSTYKIETCVKETCKNKCQKCKEMCQVCGAAAPGFSAHLCDRKCSFFYAGNGLRRAPIVVLLETRQHPIIKATCDIFYENISHPKLTYNAIVNYLNFMKKLEIFD